MVINNSSVLWIWPLGLSESLLQYHSANYVHRQCHSLHSLLANLSIFLLQLFVSGSWSWIAYSLDFSSRVRVFKCTNGIFSWSSFRINHPFSNKPESDILSHSISKCIYGINITSMSKLVFVSYNNLHYSSVRSLLFSTGCHVFQINWWMNELWVAVALAAYSQYGSSQTTDRANILHSVSSSTNFASLSISSVLSVIYWVWVAK